MNISSYGTEYNYGGYGALQNKAKTPAVSTAIHEEKQEPKSKNNNTVSDTVKGYDPFKDIAKTGSVSLPNWVYTKTEATRSDAEILKDMAELAKKHAEQGTFQNGDYEFQSLMKEYVSSASPDRENILKNTVNEINEKISYSQKNREKKEDFDPIGKLLQMLKSREKGADKIIGDASESTSGSSNGQIIYNMSGANYDACVENGKVKAAMIRDSSGETVMYIDNRNSSRQISVTQSWTEKESRRSAELLEVYNQTYCSTSSSKGLASGNSFDAFC